MVYKDVETYLNEEFRKPMKHLLEGVDEEKVNEIMNVVDFMCNRYREMNSCAKFYESKLDKTPNFKEFLEYQNKHNKYVDYDKLPSPFEGEE